MTQRIFFNEVVTRDGFQIEPEFVPTDAKVELVDELSQCGFAKIEVTSFTSPKAIPALADAEAVMAGIERVAGVPAGRIYTIADIAADPHYAARGMLQHITLEDGDKLTVPGIVPKLSRTPGAHVRNAPDIGQDTDAVMREIGLTPEQIAALKGRGVIQTPQ